MGRRKEPHMGMILCSKDLDKERTHTKETFELSLEGSPTGFNDEDTEMTLQYALFLDRMSVLDLSICRKEEVSEDALRELSETMMAGGLPICSNRKSLREELGSWLLSSVWLGGSLSKNLKPP